MNALFGEGVGYVEGSGTPGCTGVCQGCTLTSFIPDPVQPAYRYANFQDCRLNCWPYNWSVIMTLPGNPGIVPQTATVDVGLSKNDSALNGGLFNVSAVQLSAQRSEGTGDIPAGVVYCYVNKLNEQILPVDEAAYAIPGTIGDPGPYTVLVEAVSYLDSGNHRVSYRFNGTELFTTSDPFDFGPIGGFQTVYYLLGMSAPDPYQTAYGSISDLTVFGCPCDSAAAFKDRRNLDANGTTGTCWNHTKRYTYSPNGTVPFSCDTAVTFPGYPPGTLDTDFGALRMSSGEVPTTPTTTEVASFSFNMFISGGNPFASTLDVVRHYFSFKVLNTVTAGCLYADLWGSPEPDGFDWALYGANWGAGTPAYDEPGTFLDGGTVPPGTGAVLHDYVGEETLGTMQFIKRLVVPVPVQTPGFIQFYFTYDKSRFQWSCDAAQRDQRLVLFTPSGAPTNNWYLRLTTATGSDLISTLDIPEPQYEPAGAYVP